jgi:hypothetical protein
LIHLGFVQNPKLVIFYPLLEHFYPKKQSNGERERDAREEEEEEGDKRETL